MTVESSGRVTQGAGQTNLKTARREASSERDVGNALEEFRQLCSVSCLLPPQLGKSK